MNRLKVAAAATMLALLETGALLHFAPTVRTKLRTLATAPRHIGATVRDFDRLARGTA